MLPLRDDGAVRVDYFDDAAAPAASGRVPGAAAAVRDGTGRLLLTCRVDNGLWVLPGGKLEFIPSVLTRGAGVPGLVKEAGCT